MGCRTGPPCGSLARTAPRTGWSAIIGVGAAMSLALGLRLIAQRIGLTALVGCRTSVCGFGGVRFWVFIRHLGLLGRRIERTHPRPCNLISTQAVTSLPVNSILVPLPEVFSVRASVISPSSFFGRKPRTTREGSPRSRAISAMAEAYCSESPTMAVPASSLLMR